MGSGHLGLRKIIKEETNWIDKTTYKHKHDYNEHYILKELRPSGKVYYYNILKCKDCLSFKSIPQKGNVQGCIFNDLTEEEEKLPKIIGLKKHEYLIGFYDLEKVYYEE